MNKIPLISGDAALGGRVEQVTRGCRSGPPVIDRLDCLDRAVEYLNTELPDLLFLQLPGRGLDAFELLERIKGDPWLVHGGIVGLCDDDDAVDRLEEVRGANLIVILQPGSLERQLPRVLDIIHDNQRILFQREIGSNLVSEIAGHFKLNNDLLEARCYTNLVCNFLYYANRIDSEARDALGLAMYEILVNAIEHGNCQIGHEEKTAWLADHTTMNGLIEERARDPEVGRRKVTFEYAITHEGSRFLVADEGPGFDWRGVEDATGPEALLKTHGRGILMARAVTRNLSYNDKGNEVRFEIPHQANLASLTPALVHGIEPREFSPGEIVFEEGASGNFLYYIAKGRYDVLVGERTVATLSPDDIFLGEMSFLLNDRRSASVRARTPGRLIEISKREFTDAIKLHPHYALLLSRLLAQRIERANHVYDR